MAKDLQRAVLSDWAETRLMLVQLESYLDQAIRMTEHDPPACRAVSDARAVLEARRPIQQIAYTGRYADPALPEGTPILPSYEGPGKKTPEAYEAKIRLLERRLHAEVERRRRAEGQQSGTSGARTKESELKPPTGAELKVLLGLVEGWSNEAIGRDCAITIDTVKSHLIRMTRRYGVASRTGLIVLALREGWVT